jgi:hypothetical protein
MMQDLSLFKVVVADGRYLKNAYGLLRPEVTSRDDWKALFGHNPETGEVFLAPGAELELVQRCANAVKAELADYAGMSVAQVSEQSGTIVVP